MAELTTQRTDTRTLLAMPTEVTGERPAMWGDALVGCGGGVVERPCP